MKKSYLTNCTVSEAHDIDEMVNSARQITWQTFRKHVDIEELKELFPDYKMSRHDTGFLHISKDWSVSFWKSKYMGENCVYFEHSRIEYVFV